MGEVIRLFAVTAVLVSTAAILLSATAEPPRQPERPAARPAASPTLPPDQPARGHARRAGGELEETAVAYALAARNWSARTAPRAWRRQQRLATTGYRRRLERARPTRAQLAELETERASSIAIPAGRPRVSRTGRRARVIVEMHERTATTGQSVTARTRNQVTLRRHGGEWRVTGWTILPRDTP